MANSSSPIPIWSRTTFYHGIKMRSRLEATIAGALDHKGFAWEYEPAAFADEDRQYLPDFSIWLDEKTLIYLEVKGFIRTEDAVRDVQEKMEVIWRSDRDAILWLWEGWPRRRFWIASCETRWYEAAC